MVFKNLKPLFEKENRAYFAFTTWLLIGYTAYQFLPQTPGTLIRALSLWIFLYLLNTVLLYMLFSFILRDKVKKYPMRIFILCVIIALPLPWLWIISASLLSLWFSLYLLAAFFWLFITAIFTMSNCRNKAIDWDARIKKWSIIRGVLFIGGFIVALLLLWLLSVILLLLPGHTAFSIEVINFIVIFVGIVIVILFIVGFLPLLFGKMNFWLGIYFVYVAYYAVNIMIDVTKLELASATGITFLPLTIAQYIFNLYLLFSAVAGLVGEQADLIAEKVKLLKPETILMWLIFCMGMYQYGAGDLLAETTINFMSLFFPALALIFGMYAIIVYTKKPKEEIVSPG